LIWQGVEGVSRSEDGDEVVGRGAAGGAGVEVVAVAGVEGEEEEEEDLPPVGNLILCP
jgi:hypothetical protein